MSYDAAKLGEKIEDLRKEKGMTLKELSDLIYEDYDTSLNPSTISKYENGTIDKEIGAKKLIAFSQIFQVSIDTLLDNNVNKEEWAGIFMNEFGLEKSTLDELKRINNVSKPKKCLFEVKEKTVDDITELEIFNYIFSNSNILTFFLEEVRNIIKKNNEINCKIKSLENIKKISKTQKAFEKKNIENLGKEFIENRERILSDNIIKLLRKFIENQEKLLN